MLPPCCSSRPTTGARSGSGTRGAGGPSSRPAPLRSRESGARSAVQLPHNDALAGSIVGTVLAIVGGGFAYLHQHPDEAVPLAVGCLVAIHALRLARDWSRRNPAAEDDGGTSAD